MAAILVMAGLYGYKSWRFHSGKPTLTRNPKQELNATFASVPPDQRAWTILAGLTGDRAADPIGADDIVWSDYHPGDNRWPAAREFIASKQDIVAAVREAAARPVMGCELHSDPDTENPFLMDLLMPSLGRSRACARLLALDMRAAAEDRDPDRVLADFRAIVSLAEMARSHTTVIADLVAMAIFSLGVEELSRVVPSRPDLFADAALAELQLTGRGFAGGDFRLQLGGERLLAHDMIQRLFTDDGNGDGRVCADGLRNLNSFGGRPRHLSLSQALLTPVVVGSLPGRRRCTETLDYVFDCLEQDALTPRWERTRVAAFQEYERIQRSGPVLIRALTLAIPAIDKAIAAADVVDMQQDALILGLALERHRLRHGEYPAAITDLAPEFLGSVPTDAFTGRPLSLLLEGGGPVIYSFGCDLDDDRGVSPAQRSNAVLGTALNTAVTERRAQGDYRLWPVPRKPRPWKDAEEAPTPPAKDAAPTSEAPGPR